MLLYVRESSPYIYIYIHVRTGEIQVSMRFPVGIQVANAMRRLLVQLICRVICAARDIRDE